jgi:hypothetical protein
MDSLFAFIGLAILVVIAFILARFVLRLTAKIIGCILTTIVALGILAIFLYFFF